MMIQDDSSTLCTPSFQGASLSIGQESFRRPAAMISAATTPRRSFGTAVATPA
jgi:hypothetical protein